MFTIQYLLYVNFTATGTPNLQSTSIPPEIELHFLPTPELFSKPPQHHLKNHLV